MAERIKKISITKLEPTIKSNCITVAYPGFEDLQITIKNTLSLGEALEFIESVVSACIDEEANDYIPHAGDFATRINVLTMYANLTMPQNIDKQYDFAYRTDLYPFILEFVSSAQLNALLDAIEKKVKFITQAMHSNINNKLSELVSALEQTASVTDQIFEGMAPDDVSKVLKNLSSIQDGVDEAKLVQAVYELQTGGATVDDTASARTVSDNIITLPIPTEGKE